MTDKNEAQYEKRYCAFIDILGFSELIERLGSKQLPYSRVRDLLRTVYEPPRSEHVTFFAASGLRAQSISDAVCISVADSVHGLSHLFHIVGDLALELLKDGFFIRGAIVKGNLYHDERMVFGEALVQAYRFEQNVARFPRVVMTREVATDATKFVDEDDVVEVCNWVRQADDGPFYLHVLNLVEILIGSSLPEDWERPTHVEKYNKMADQIQTRFDESVDNPRHFEKVQWFAKYWNDTVRFSSKDDMKVIIGPGAAKDPAIYT